MQKSEAIRRIHAVLTTVSTLHDDVESFMEERGDEWQDSDRGQAWEETRNNLEEAKNYLEEATSPLD